MYKMSYFWSCLWSGRVTCPPHPAHLLLNKGVATHAVLVHCSALAQSAVWIGSVHATDIAPEGAQEQVQVTRHPLQVQLARHVQ